MPVFIYTYNVLGKFCRSTYYSSLSVKNRLGKLNWETYFSPRNLQVKNSNTVIRGAREKLQTAIEEVAIFVCVVSRYE